MKREGIRVFAINLGWVHSEGEQALQTGFHGLPENWAEEIGRRMPAGRLIVPEDVAGLFAYLVSPSAQMMTGAIIDYEQMPAGRVRRPSRPCCRSKAATPFHGFLTYG